MDGIRTQLMKKNASRSGLPARWRIFIVDDHPLVREWLAGLVAREPDLVICGQAEDAPTALVSVALAQPDLIVVDLSLNRSSGMELIKDLRAQFPAAQILVLSMHEEASIAERALRAGARGYILKGESATRVIEAIRSVLAGQFYVSARLMSQLAGLLFSGAARPGASPVDLLSDREIEVFQLRGQGRAAKEIAEQLKVSVKTVETYEARIKEKLGLRTAGELMREAVRWHDRKHNV
jgi:DNA-binding NarL/FixJ family response regulator